MKDKKAKPKLITLAPMREIQVRCGDVFAGGMDEIVVVAIDGKTLPWARPPIDKMPKLEHVAVRNANTGRMSVMLTRNLQRKHGRRAEIDAAASLRELAKRLGLKVKAREAK